MDWESFVFDPPHPTLGFHCPENDMFVMDLKVREIGLIIHPKKNENSTCYFWRKIGNGLARFGQKYIPEKSHLASALVEVELKLNCPGKDSC